MHHSEKKKKSCLKSLGVEAPKISMRILFIVYSVNLRRQILYKDTSDLMESKFVEIEMQPSISRDTWQKKKRIHLYLCLNKFWSTLSYVYMYSYSSHLKKYQNNTLTFLTPLFGDKFGRYVCFNLCKSATGRYKSWEAVYGISFLIPLQQKQQ